MLQKQIDTSRTKMVNISVYKAGMGLVERKKLADTVVDTTKTIEELVYEIKEILIEWDHMKSSDQIKLSSDGAELSSMDDITEGMEIRADIVEN